MTKNHFIALADAIRDHNEYESPPTFGDGHLEVLADFCASQNPAFNRQRWLDYVAGKCGPNGGKI